MTSRSKNRNTNSFEAPISAQQNAISALECKKEYNLKHGTRIGWTRARQLAKGEKLSFNTIERMYKFKRHRKNAEYKGNPCLDKGKVMWDAWGGDEGIEWAEKMFQRYKKGGKI